MTRTKDPVVFDEAYLRSQGFVGFVSAADLVASRCTEIPADPGVYAVIRSAETTRRFRSVSVAGHFKGKDPTVVRSTLEAAWVEGTTVLYIGMAGTSLRKRVKDLVDYGAGKPKGHQGGRYLWQVQGSASFLVAWRPGVARTMETKLLAAFEAAYGHLPFANLGH
jgi:hypothetical protein